MLSVGIDEKYEAGAATIYVPGLVPFGNTVEIVIGAVIGEDPVYIKLDCTYRAGYATK